MVLDNLIRQQPSQKHFTFGRSIFTTEGRRPLPNGAELWQGFYQSVRPTAGMYQDQLIYCIGPTVADHFHR